MISLLRRFLGILSLGRGAGFSGAHGWVRPGSTITDSVEFSLRLDSGGLVLPGELRLDRLFTRESAPAMTTAAAPSPAPAVPTAEATTPATAAPSTGSVVEPAAPEREDRKTTRAA